MTLTPLFDWTPLNTQKWLAWLSTLLNIANSCLGPGQTWQNFSPLAQGGPGTRLPTTNYTNDTSRPIVIEVTCSESGYPYFVVEKIINYEVIAFDTIDTEVGGTYYHAATLVVPPGATYQIAVGQATLYTWWELR